MKWKTAEEVITIWGIFDDVPDMLTLKYPMKIYGRELLPAGTKLKVAPLDSVKVKFPDIEYNKDSSQVAVLINNKPMICHKSQFNEIKYVKENRNK